MELITTIITTIIIIMAAVWTSYSFYLLVIYLGSVGKHEDTEETVEEKQKKNRAAFKIKMARGNVVIDEPMEILGQKITTRELP